MYKKHKTETAKLMDEIAQNVAELRLRKQLVLDAFSEPVPGQAPVPWSPEGRALSAVKCVDMERIRREREADNQEQDDQTAQPKATPPQATDPDKAMRAQKTAMYHLDFDPELPVQ